MADLVAQTKLDEITFGKIQGDAIRMCIERLNNTIQRKDDSVLRANMQTYQKEMLFDVGGDLTLKPILNTQKLSAFDAVPVEDSEKHLKKLIKHAKTPMERKMHEKQLNALYKKKKKK